MKFFTMDWWLGTQPDADPPYKGVDPFQAYGAYLTSIQEKIPDSIRKFHGKVPLHDAKLYVASYSQESATLTLILGNFNPERMKYQRLFLQYSGVISFESNVRPSVGFSDIGYGDLGYDEIDMTSDGYFEHRILFSTGVEFDILRRDAFAWWDIEKTDITDIGG